MGNYDVVVIGGSAGSFNVIREIIASLEPGFTASVFVVIHLSPREKSVFAQVLGRGSRLRVLSASEGAAIEPSTVYTAVPNRHLIVGKNHIHLSHGPKEGLHRPSINMTFRSAAAAYGERTIGVLLSGLLDDGASGVSEIARHGGVAIVQDPSDALFPDMPASAVSDGVVHYKLRAEEIASVLNRLVSGAEKPPMKNNLPHDNGQPAPDFFTCPECHGPLREIEATPSEFACRVGHRFALRTLVAEQTATQERRLYEAIVSLEEGADLLTYAADKLKLRQSPDMQKEAEQLRGHAKVIRKLLEDHQATPLD